jgi:tellurite resistance protein
MRQWSEFQVKTLIELQDALDKVIRAAFRVANISGQVANGEMSMEQAIKSEAAFHVMRNQALKLTLLAEPDSFSS